MCLERRDLVLLRSFITAGHKTFYIKFNSYCFDLKTKNCELINEKCALKILNKKNTYRPKSQRRTFLAFKYFLKRRVHLFFFLTYTIFLRSSFDTNSGNINIFWVSGLYYGFYDFLSAILISVL